MNFTRIEGFFYRRPLFFALTFCIIVKEETPRRAAIYRCAGHCTFFASLEEGT